MRSTAMISLALLAAACGKPKQKEVDPNPTEPTSVAPEETKEQEVPEFVGVVTSRNSKVLVAEFGGRIERLNLHAGKRVRKDEILAKLDTGDIATEIAQLMASERSSMSAAGADGATAAAARVGLKAAQRARRFGAVSGMDTTMRDAEARAAGARAGAQSQQAAGFREQRKRLEELLPRAEIKSPIDGVVMMVRAKEGEMAQKGTQIARVFDPTDLLFRFAVPKEHRSKIKLGERVQLHVEGVDHLVWATIEAINQELEPPMSFTVVDADIDDSRLQPDEIRVASQGKVRLVAPVAKQKPQQKADATNTKPRTASANP